MKVNIISGTLDIPDVGEFLKFLNNIAARHGVVVQALDADKLAGERHLKFAVEKAIRSFELGRNIATSLEMEILLYAAGTRQIGRALDMGVRKGRNNVAIVVVGNKASIEIKERIAEAPVLEYTKDKRDALMEFFGITDLEVWAAGEEKIPELVLERVALVDVIK